MKLPDENVLEEEVPAAPMDQDFEGEESGAPEEEEYAPVQIENEVPISNKPSIEDSTHQHADGTSVPEPSLKNIVGQNEVEQIVDNVEQSFENVEKSVDMLPGDLEEALKAAIGESVSEESSGKLQTTESSDLLPMDTDI